MICGSALTWASNDRVDRRSWRPSVAATYICSGNPTAAGSMLALITRITPDSLSRRTRFSVAAGDRPTSRASSTLVRSASACSSVSSRRSISSITAAMLLNIILFKTMIAEFRAASALARGMNNSRRLVFPALVGAGVLWGTTVPLSKVALGWLPPAWLAFGRFAIAAIVLMAVSGPRLRAACKPAILVTGAIGYGGSVLLQNIGIERTSVTHAALLIGATPVLVAIMAATLGHSVARPLAWAGFMLSLAGVGLIAGGQGHGSTMSGDALVLAAQLVSA